MRFALPGGLRASAAMAALALTTTVTAGTAHADLLGPTTPVVEGIVGEPVPTGWLYDSSAATMDEVRTAIRADWMWGQGYTGEGVGVALIDTGVVPVDGLTSGNVVNGPDLSFESQSDEARYLDTFGHGTHMAGIIAGHDAGSALDPTRFRGVAPD